MSASNGDTAGSGRDAGAGGGGGAGSARTSGALTVFVLAPSGLTVTVGAPVLTATADAALPSWPSGRGVPLPGAFGPASPTPGLFTGWAAGGELYSSYYSGAFHSLRETLHIPHWREWWDEDGVRQLQDWLQSRYEAYCAANP